MQPIQTLVRQFAVIAISFLFSLAVRYGILSTESSALLNPLVMEVVNHYLPVIIPVIATLCLNVYQQFIQSRLHVVARELPAGATEQQVNQLALGTGGKATAAKLLLGVKQ